MKPQMNSSIGKLHDLGQRIWLENITREMLNNRTLARYIAELSVTGLRLNPRIFEHATSSARPFGRLPNRGGLMARIRGKSSQPVAEGAGAA